MQLPSGTRCGLADFCLPLNDPTFPHQAPTRTRLLLGAPAPNPHASPPAVCLKQCFADTALCRLPHQIKGPPFFTPEKSLLVHFWHYAAFPIRSKDHLFSLQKNHFWFTWEFLVHLGGISPHLSFPRLGKRLLCSLKSGLHRYKDFFLKQE